MKAASMVRMLACALTFAVAASLLAPTDASACHRKSYCYTPCYTYCYTTCYTPQPCPPLKPYCVVYRYDPCYCAYVVDSYPPDEAGAKARVDTLKKAGCYAYYCCYELKYAVYSYDAAKCCWVLFDKIFDKEQDAKDEVKKLLEKGPATYLPFLAPKCVP